MRNIVFLVLLIVVSCTSKPDFPIKQNLHANWLFKKTNDSIWLTAKVPGNVYTDLQQHHIIEDPFIKNNEEKTQWVSEKEWIYKTNFTLSPELLKKQFITLTFDGLDTYSSIYINDSLLGKTTNAFRAYTFAVKNLVTANNELTIVFSPTTIEEEKAKKQIAYTLPEGNRIFTRKAQFQYGWDWGPKLNTSGIWKNVHIKAWNHLTFDAIFIQQNTITKEKASLTIQATIESDHETEGQLSTEVNHKKLVTELHLKKGKHTYEIPFTIQNPQLWWVHNLGTPYLYQFNFNLTSNGIQYDTKSIKKGLRTVRLITQKDSIGETFYFELNGQPLYAKGANYIPQHSFQNKVSSQHYQKLLTDVVLTNMNMLRVWGGGIYEHDIFYSLCDEKGILVWQDFMFACAMYPGNTEFLNTVQIEAEQQVKRLRNHASIALWCGNNENSEGWHRWGWQTGRSDEEKKQIWKDYLAVFDSILPKTVHQYSDSTSYWESSPKYGRGNPKYEFEGDAHDWWVWHDATPFEHFEQKVPRFMSEFGFQSFPGYEVINYINQKDTVDIHTSAIQAHQKHSRGFQLIHEYMKRDYPVPVKDDDYVYVSQLLQAKGMIMGIEAHRRAKPYNMGTLYWQLNDCWPAISWSGIDYFGNWKALQYKAKKAFKNLLISAEIKNDSATIFVVNDSLSPVSGKLALQLIDFDGKISWTDTKEITVTPNSSQAFYKLPLNSVQKNSVVFVAKFNNETSIIYLTSPKSLALKKGNLRTNITPGNGGFFIHLKSNTLLKDVFLTSKVTGHFSDNFFDLLPNEEKVIFLTTKAEKLEGLLVKTLNDLK
ncbi:beta-mannosidase [Tenacibaculum sp. TC6]|uniref:beta-mannosidase n=1 Tax=Tenacibaculum sp. TC6 TaxID=3423223 RepID=UPI003D360B38